MPWRKLSAFHNICVWHVTFYAAEQCQYYFCDLGNRVCITGHFFFYIIILGGGRSENWEENLHRCSRSSLHNLRPWQFAQIHMPQYVVILIYMKISGRRAHVSFITSQEGDFHCITEQGAVLAPAQYKTILLWMTHAKDIRINKLKKTTRKKIRFVSLMFP